MPFDLIHTHTESAPVLTTAQILDNCPAAFTKTKNPELSGRYGFVDTAAAISILNDHRWNPVRAVQKPSRLSENIPFQEHMISFAPAQLDDRENQPNIILYNSHNGKSALKLFVGVYRCLCSNGIIAGDSLFESKMRHSATTANGFSNLIQSQSDNVPMLMDKIDGMQNHILDHDQIVDFAYDAVNLRWDMLQDTPPDNRNGSYADQFRTVKQALRVRRHGDGGNDKYTVFNRLQESLIRGGVEIESYTKRNPNGATRKAKPLASLAETVRVNRELWNLADRVAA
jgi:hypothetical protein